MSDRYIDFVNSPLGQLLAKNLGLPAPLALDRFKADAPVVKGAVLVGAAAGGELTAAITQVLANIKAEVFAAADSAVHGLASAAGLATVSYAPAAEDGQKFKALVFDASGITRSDDLIALHSFFSPVIRKLANSSRIIPESDSR